MPYALRLISPPGKSALANEADTVSLALASVTGTVEYGAYLEWSDPDAKAGLGDDRWTDDPAKAKRFDSFADAMMCWTAQSTTRPLRDDGKPNRPLTAYSITIEEMSS